MATSGQAKIEPRPPETVAGEGRDGRFGRLVAHPGAILAAVAAVVLVLGWQFITDASRTVPALDTAFYQWRVEYLLRNDPAALIELRGAAGSLAGGYRVAQPVLGALMRTVGGVGADTPTVVLSVLFRVLAAVAMAAFAWRHRRNWLLFYLTLAVIPALFLLQRFFGYMDNFLTLSLLAGVLLLMDRMHTSWGARVAATAFMFLAGLSHPTTLVVFLLSMGAVGVYRLVRDRSLLSPLRSEGLVVATGTVAVALTAAFWMGGLWGPATGFGDAAVPPPASASYFLQRSAGVFRTMEPFFPVLLLFPLIALGLGHLLVRLVRDREYFSEVTAAWTLPVVGMLGFLMGAAYPYFRFFNATLAPLLLATLGLATIVSGALRLRRGALARAAPVAAAAFVLFVLGTWWVKGLSGWHQTPTWLTPEVRTTGAAARALLAEQPGDAGAVFVVDAPPRPGATQFSYGQYKEFANAIYASLDGGQIDDAALYFGSVEDLAAGRTTRTGDEIYDGLAGDTAREALPRLREGAVVAMPAPFNRDPPNATFLERCSEPECVQVGRSGLYVLRELSTVPPAPQALAAATSAAEDARAFAADPPGPFADLGRTALATLRLALLFALPGWLFYRRFADRSVPEAVAMVPLLSIAAVTAIGVIAVAVVRGPFTPAVGWASWGIAVALGLVGRLPAGVARRRDAVFAAPARVIDDIAGLFRKRDFTFLMGSQWLAQAADGLVAVALAKEITFGGQAGFNLDIEAARTPREALLIVLLTFLPYTLFSPFVGVLIDRWNRRRLLIGANALRVLVLGAIAALGIAAIGDAALYVGFLLILAGTRLVLAIKGASLPATLGERDLLAGNSVSQAGSAIFQLLGAGVAIVAAGFVDVRAIIAAGVVVYALAVLSATGTRTLGYGRKVVPLREELSRLVGDFIDGVREVRRRAAAALALASFLALRALLTFVVLATVFISRAFIAAEGPLTTAIPGAAGALGAALGFVVAQFLKDRVAPDRIVVGALILGGAGMLAFGGVVNLLGISAMAAVVGVSFFLGKIGVDTMMQQSLADAFRGRGFSLQDIVYNLSWIIPALVLFLLLTPATARVLLVGGGGVFLAAALGIALWARSARAELTARPATR